MVKIGSYNEMIVSKHVDFGIYLWEGEGTPEILMPSRYVPEGVEPGQQMTVFVYTDSEDRPIATTEEPLAVVGQFASMMVKEVNKFGAFMEWGLPKDLFVPFKAQFEPMEVGRKYVVMLDLDQITNRVFATSKLFDFFYIDPDDLQEGDKVDLMVYYFSDLGWRVVVNNRYQGQLYENEIFQDIEIGQKLQGYVKHIRNDGKIDVVLQKPGYQALIESTTNVVLDKLKASENGFLPFHSKTDAEIIKREFNLSKKAFKKIIGGLYKEKTITITDTGIKLNK